MKDLESLAGGRLYSGRMAKQSKLVDDIGTLEDAVAEAKRLAGLKSDEKIDRLILPKPRSFFEELFGGPLMQSEAKFIPSSATVVIGQLLGQYAASGRYRAAVFRARSAGNAVSGTRKVQLKSSVSCFIHAARS